MNPHSNQQVHIIYYGIDYPDIFAFWELNDLIIASAILMVFILMQEILLGLFLCALVLYGLHKLKSHHIRGKQDHLLWQIGFISQKGFQTFPPSSAVRFSG